ncbi:MAG: hypothetical protein KDK99_00915 [Verrucomicrobiales bacterium]|nr:hypothetical protein [Verrucomicrobiales bacterium]
MPATPYIVGTQIALVAASAAYFQVTRADKPRLGHAEAAAISSYDARGVAEGMDLQSDLATVPQFPSGEVSRFAVMERRGEGGRVPIREMGFRPGDLERSTMATDVMIREGGATPKVVKAIPVDAAGQSELSKPPSTTEPQLAGALDELPEPFDPVPDGVGYNITADAATNFDLDSRTVVFSGNVRLVTPSLKLAADHMVVHMEGGAEAMDRLVANGNVEVVMEGQSQEGRYHGYAEEATFDAKAGRIQLMGWPRIIGMGREHRAASAGTVMTLHTNPARLETDGRAQTRIVPLAE